MHFTLKNWPALHMSSTDRAALFISFLQKNASKREERISAPQ
jgi:hypothetical protein